MNSTEYPNRLLVIDDEPEVCELIAEIAESVGFDVVTTRNVGDFWTSYLAFEPSVIVLDLHLPQTDGIEVLRQLAEHRCSAHILLISGTDARILQTAERLGTTRGLNMIGRIRKPFDVPELKTRLAEIFREDRAIGAEDLREAIDSGQLIVHYQPKIEFTTQNDSALTGCEALVRWQHPVQGVLMPGTFIPLAESTNLIVPLTDFVLRSAIEQIGHWNDQGSVLSVAVNIAPQLLDDLELPNRISNYLARFDVHPSKLILEITESGAMADAARTMEVLTRFRLKGFGLSIDDFGTGYSSLVQLHRMPFNEMKIDQSFVVEVPQDEETVKIVRSIIRLGHDLGLSLCAEGVETKEALEWLRSEKCERAQGYLIGKPVPATEFAALAAA